MKTRATFLGLALILMRAAFAQGIVSVDLLEPAESVGPLPAHLRIVDVLVDVPSNDQWNWSGIRALTANGAIFAYHDGDPNTPGLQPGLLAPGLADRFLTSVSRSRGRNSNSRFLSPGAAIAGAYNPSGPQAITNPTELNASWFKSPPEDEWPFGIDGWVARVTVDISNVSGAPADYSLWGVGSQAPPGATVVLSSNPPHEWQSPGTVCGTFHFPGLAQHGFGRRGRIGIAPTKVL
ncbi:MAG: hypothetical protein HZB38_07880 [Planctomycetes bacterium]|nr:hypothetical protein [Planctomycetota bacterium]